jgi:hypothetical protein
MAVQDVNALWHVVSLTGFTVSNQRRWQYIPAMFREPEYQARVINTHPVIVQRQATLYRFKAPLGCYLVLRCMENDTNSRQAGLFGPAENGYYYTAQNEPCQVDPLPKTIKVLRQQMVTRVVVRAFFEKTLATDPTVQEQPQRYLEQAIETELAQVSYAQ